MQVQGLQAEFKIKEIIIFLLYYTITFNVRVCFIRKKK